MVNINWDIFRVQLLWEYGFRITTGAVPAQPECECSIPISVIRVEISVEMVPDMSNCPNNNSGLHGRSPWIVPRISSPEWIRPQRQGSSTVRNHTNAWKATGSTNLSQCHDRLQKMENISYIATYIIYTVYAHYIYIAYWIVSMDKHGVHFLCQAAIAPRASCRIKVPEGWSCQRNSQCISAILNKSFSQSFCVFSQNRSKIIYDHLWSKMIIRWSLRCQWMSHTDMMSPWDPWIHGPSNHVAPPSKDTLMVTGPAGCGGAMQRSLTASISENLII